MRLPLVSISTYTFGFIMSVGLVLTVAIVLLYGRFDEFQQLPNLQKTEYSKIEIEASASRLVGEVRDLLERLSDSEDARSAVSGSLTASQWIRSEHSKIIKNYPFIKDLTIYSSAKDKIAAAVGESTSHSINKLSTDDVYIEDPANNLVVFATEIKSKLNGGQIAYIGALVNLQEALRDNKRYIYTDEYTLNIDLTGKNSFRANNLSQLVTAAPKEHLLRDGLNYGFNWALISIVLLIVVLCCLFYFVISKSLITPLRRLSIHIDRMRETDGTLKIIPPAGVLQVAELAAVSDSLNSYQSELDTLHNNLASKTQELWSLAHHDVLTGSFNRRAFEEDWDNAVRLIARNRIGVCLMLFDCDRFKSINDVYGHQVGDQVIQIVSRSLQTALRQGDRLYRLGGDEFATLLLDADVDQAIKVAERCLGCIDQGSFSRLGINEPIRFSVGISHAKETQACTLDLLHRQADIAMYHAKRPNNQKLVVFQQEMDRESNAPYLNSVVDAVYRAISSGEGLVLHYHPVVNLRNGQADFYEVLTRIDTKNGLILPSSINAIVSARELEVEFDRAVLKIAGEQLKGSELPEKVALSLNLSGPSIINKVVVDKLIQLSDYNTRNPLLLEVTETSWIPHLQQASINLNQLRDSGYRVILDDFGSGFSSLNYLAVMPVDLIKLDMTLIRNLSQDSGESQFVNRLAKLLLDAGYILVAEGIENSKSLSRVVEVGFSHGQGFWFGKPSRQFLQPEHTEMLIQPQTPIKFH